MFAKTLAVAALGILGRRLGFDYNGTLCKDPCNEMLNCDNSTELQQRLTCFHRRIQCGLIYRKPQILCGMEEDDFSRRKAVNDSVIPTNATTPQPSTTTLSKQRSLQRSDYELQLKNPGSLSNLRNNIQEAHVTNETANIESKGETEPKHYTDLGNLSFLMDASVNLKLANANSSNNLMRENKVTTGDAGLSEAQGDSNKSSDSSNSGTELSNHHLWMRHGNEFMYPVHT